MNKEVYNFLITHDDGSCTQDSGSFTFPEACTHAGTLAVNDSTIDSIAIRDVDRNFVNVAVLDMCEYVGADISHCEVAETNASRRPVMAEIGAGSDLDAAEFSKRDWPQ